MNRFYCGLVCNLLRVDDFTSLNSASIMFTAHDFDRGYAFDNKAYSQLVDSLVDIFNAEKLSCITIATPFSRLVGKRAYGKVSSVNGKFARAYLLRFLQRKLLFKHRRLNGCYVSEVWTKILKKIQPKIIIGIQPDKELCVSARELGIPIFDLQHGVLSNEGYYGENYRREMNQQGWPDGFLCWDEESASWAKHNCISGLAIVLGNPWISRFVYPKEDDKLVSRANANLRLPRRFPKVLVTLTWGLGLYCNNASPLGIAQEVIDTILSNKIDCQWLLRLHPMQLRGNRVKQTLSLLKKTFGHMDNVEWENSSYAPLPLILKQIDLHLTCLSSVIIEAVRFGVKSGVVFENLDLLRKWYGPQLDLGLAVNLSFRREEITSWVDSSLRQFSGSKDQNVMHFDANRILEAAGYSAKCGKTPS